MMLAHNAGFRDHKESIVFSRCAGFMTMKKKFLTELIITKCTDTENIF